MQSTGELIRLWREGKVPLLMVAYSWMLGQVGDVLGVQPGEEFRVALVEAQKVGDDVQTICCRQARLQIMLLYGQARGLASWEYAIRTTADEVSSVSTSYWHAGQHLGGAASHVSERGLLAWCWAALSQ